MAKKYPEQEIEDGLLAAATYGIRPAAEQTGIPHQTLYDWTTKWHVERYAEIKSTVAAKVRERAAAKWEDQADELLEVQAKLVEGFRDEVGRLDPKDKPNAIKAINIAAGVATDKANGLRDRPTVTVEHNINLPQIDSAISLLMKQAEEKQKAIDVESVELDDGPAG